MNNNHQMIHNHIHKGDILLARYPNSLIRTKIDGVIRTNWELIYIYLGNDKILDYSFGDPSILELSDILSQNLNLGLFRVFPELTDDKIESLFLFIKEISHKYCYELDLAINTTEIIAAAYEKMGILFSDLQYCDMLPVDFDESKMTIRVV